MYSVIYKYTNADFNLKLTSNRKRMFMKKYINNYLIRNNLNYDLEIIIYGIKVILFNFITIFICLVNSFLNNEITFGVLFITFFCFLRIKYSGFHCKTPQSCIITMIMIFSILMVVQKSGILNSYITLFFIVSQAYQFYFLRVHNEFIVWIVSGIIILAYSFFRMNLINIQIPLSICIAVIAFHFFYYFKID